MIGKRIDVRHLWIADDKVDEAGIGAHILRLADWHSHHNGAVAAADLDRSRLRIRIAGHAQNRCYQRNNKRDRKITQPVATLRGPVLEPPAKADVNFMIIIHDTLPTPN